MGKLADKQQIFALNVSKLIQEIFSSGYTCSIGECYRTSSMAEIYAKQGRGIFNSQHCDRLAIDLNIFSPSGNYENKTESYSQFGEYWESLHPKNRWGGHFSRRPDGNHFEMDE